MVERNREGAVKMRLKSVKYPVLRLMPAIILLTGLAFPVLAQSFTSPYASALRNYNVRSMSFSLWCQQTQSYLLERCEERRPEDVQTFEDFRALIERYEIQYLKKVERDLAARDRNKFDLTDTVRGFQSMPLR